MTQQIYMIQYRPADGFPWEFVVERTDSSVVYLSKEEAGHAAHRMARINLTKYEFRVVLMRIAEVVE